MNGRNMWYVCGGNTCDSYWFISVPWQLFFRTPNDFFDPKQVSKAHYVGHASPNFCYVLELRNLPGHPEQFNLTATLMPSIAWQNSPFQEPLHYQSFRAGPLTRCFSYVPTICAWSWGFFGTSHPLLLRPALEGCGIHHLVALHSETLAPKPKYFLQRWETNHKESPQRGWTPGLRSAGMFARAKSK